MTVLLEAEGLTKSFAGTRRRRGARSNSVVKDVSLQVSRGETLGIVGETGAGKSTVGRMLIRLTDPDHGRVRFLGEELATMSRSDLRRFRARARMIFQDPFSSLDPMMSIGDSVAESVLLHSGLSGDSRRERVEDLLERVGLGARHYPRRPHEFSGGQLQRVAVARAIATNPDLVVCDEPVAALDMSIRAQVINLLLDLQQELGIAYVFISHDLSLVRHIAHRTVVMYRGRIVEEGPTERLFEDPQHPYTRELLDSVPLLDQKLRLERDEASAALPRVGPALPDDHPGCAYLPRCPLAQDTCSRQVPELRISRGLNVACHVRTADPS